MGEKIWFIYLTDHHEGPFTPEEVADKFHLGLVNGQSLSWKDGMPEWVPLETIPELAEAVQGNAQVASPSPEPEPSSDSAEKDDNFSLAQMLAQSQGGAAPATAASPAPQSQSNVTNLPRSNPMAASANLAQEEHSEIPEPEPEDEVWTLNVQGQVSGLYSLHSLGAKAAEIPQTAQIWRPGWQDFKPFHSVPYLATAKKNAKVAKGEKTQITRTGITNPAFTAGRKPAIAPITASGGDLGDDEPTNPDIDTGKAGFLQKIKGLFKKKEPKKAAANIVAKPNIKANFKKANSVKSGIVRVASSIAVLLALVAGGGVYFFYFMSPLPFGLDVSEDDAENMKETIKAPASKGVFRLVVARGTEDNPADDTDPKFYVASNLKAATPITLTLEGIPGTLVNRTGLKKSYTASIGKNQFATFDKLKEDGKPIPMGEYNLTIASEGAEPLVVKRFLGGKKGAVYEKRLKQYKDKIQGDYDKDIQELRELSGSLKSVYDELAKRLNDYKNGWSNPSDRNRIANEWKAYLPTFNNFFPAVEKKIAAKTDGPAVQLFKDLLAVSANFNQLVLHHGTRIDGGTPPTNPDELLAQINTGLNSVEQSLATAMLKSPFDPVEKPKPANKPIPPADAAAAPAKPVPVK